MIQNQEQILGQISSKRSGSKKEQEVLEVQDALLEHQLQQEINQLQLQILD